MNSLQLESDHVKSTKSNDDEIKNHAPIESSANSGPKTVQLINEIQKIDDQTIKPFVDFNEGKLFYPFLSTIGLKQDDDDFLNDLTREGILEKKIFEKLVVCPVHSNTFSSSVHLYCPNCHSIDVEKLNLFEHKRCGYISDGKNFDFSNPDMSECPSCKKAIKNFDKEIRVPAMWFQCNECEEKFDNVDIKLHCRKYEHDFDTNSAQFLPTYSYILKNSEYVINSDDVKIIQELLIMFNGFNYNVETHSFINGKSGNPHKIPIFGTNQQTGTKIMGFVSNSNTKLDESTITSILVPVLDIEPHKTLLITHSEVPESVYSMAKRYNIDIIAHSDFSQIMSRVESFLASATSTGVKNEN